MKIIVLDGYTLNPGDISWEPLSSQGELVCFDRTEADQVAKRIGDAEAVFTGKALIGRDVFDACPNIRFIGAMSTGYNIIDVEEAKRRGVMVANVPAYASEAVAQHTFALLLAITNRVAEHSASVRRGEWTANPDWCYWLYPIMELKDKTIGIIGFGRIGQETARLATAFRMRVLAYDEVLNPALEKEGFHYADLDRVLTESDVIALHCPLFPSTRGIINKSALSKMKDGVIILNASRGPLVVENDLRDALASGKVYCAGVDVVSTESIEMDNPLLEVDNVYFTPHIAWAPRETRTRMMRILAENLRQFMAGTPVNIVNA